MCDYIIYFFTQLYNTYYISYSRSLGTAIRTANKFNYYYFYGSTHLPTDAKTGEPTSVFNIAYITIS